MSVEVLRGVFKFIFALLVVIVVFNTVQAIGRMSWPEAIAVIIDVEQVKYNSEEMRRECHAKKQGNLSRSSSCFPSDLYIYHINFSLPDDGPVIKTRFTGNECQGRVGDEVKLIYNAKKPEKIKLISSHKSRCQIM